MRDRMWMQKLELNFSDFCKYSCISEINYPKKETSKYWLNLLDLSVVLILKTD